MKLPPEITEPSMLEKCRSAATLSRFASIGGFVVLLIGYSMKVGLGNDGPANAVMKMAIMLMFPSAVSIGSGAFALKGLKDGKFQIIGFMIASVIPLIIYLAMTLS